MKRRNTILMSLLLAGLVPLAIWGCAAMLFIAVPAPMVGQERNFDITRPQETTAAAPAPAGAVSDARTKYTQAEKAVENFVRSLGKKARSDADRAALRSLVAKAFEQRQELLRLELAEFQSRMNRLSQQLADRAEGREKVIDRRVDELLTPNLRWEEAVEPATHSPEKRKVVANDLKPSSQRQFSRDDMVLLQNFAADLQGVWLAVEQGSNGEMRPFKTNFTLTFNEKQYAFREGDAQPYSLGTYALPEVASGLPFAALDLTRTYLKQAGGPNPFAPDQPQVEHAIVAIKGDTLRMCSGGQRFNDRPDDFTTAKDDGRLLMVYRRVSRKPLGDIVVPPETGPNAMQPGGSNPPPGLGQPRNQTPINEEPLKTIEPPLLADKGAAEKLQKALGFELKSVSGEAVGQPPFRGGLQIVSIREKSPAALAGLRTDDILVGAHVWETLSSEHLQFAVDRTQELRKNSKGLVLILSVHLVRSRPPFRELLKTSIQVPMPEAVEPKVDPTGGIEPSPLDKPGPPASEKSGEDLK